MSSNFQRNPFTFSLKVGLGLAAATLVFQVGYAVFNYVTYIVIFG